VRKCAIEWLERHNAKFRFNKLWWLWLTIILKANDKGKIKIKKLKTTPLLKLKY
jgi:hypothetical protein